MVKRLRDLNDSIKQKITFDRDEALKALEEGIAEQREKLVQKPANDDIDIRRVSQQYDIDEENRRFVRTELSKMQNQNKRISFGQAFKNARSAGKKTFWWKGKEYNTKIKSQANAKKKSANNKQSSNKTTSNKTTSTTSNKTSSTNNSTSNKQRNTANSTTNKKTVTNTKSATNTKAASTNKRNTEVVKKRASNFESNSNRYGSRNNFEFKQNYQAPKKETTPKRRVRQSDEQLMRELRKIDEKRIRSQKNNPVYKRKGTKLESMLGM